MKTFTCTQKIKLRDFTDGTYPQGSFAFNALLRRGDIRVNGAKTRSDMLLNVGDVVTYYTTAAEEAKPCFKAVYEDDNLLVADKFSGVTSEALFSALSDRAAYPVHRLDRNTCGLIAIAKTEECQQALIEAFRERKVEKIYLCLAKNAFRRQSAVLTAYLKKDEKAGIVRISDSPSQGAAKIVTEYSVVERSGDYALVRVTLHTGKTHQIRAHLAHIGCPVLGDEKYGDGALNDKYHARRQILVAKSLAFSLGGGLAYLNKIKLESSFFPELPAR